MTLAYGCLVTLSVLLASGAARADESRRVVTPREVAMAVDAGPWRRFDMEKLKAIRASVDAADPWPAPSASVASSRVTARLIVGVSVPLPGLHSRGAAKRLAQADVGVTAAENELHRLELVTDAQLRWIDLAEAEALAGVAVQASTGAAQLVRIARARREAGAVSISEVTIAEAQEARARSLVASANDEVAAASVALAVAMGIDPLVGLTTGGASWEQPTSSSGAHPSQLLAQANVRLTDAAMAVTHAENQPKFSIGVETSWFDPTEPRTDVRVAVSMELPLWGRGAARSRAAARAKAAAVIAAERDQLALDGARALTTVETRASTEQLRSLHDEVLPLQVKALAQATAEYSDGALSIADVLAASRDELAVRRELVQATMRAARAAVAAASTQGRDR